ncbi:hypothetical protein [Kineococcus arenarius]
MQPVGGALPRWRRVGAVADDRVDHLEVGPHFNATRGNVEVTLETVTA